ncbi:SafA/ExsA family spore coat assembly protein [Amphibacillus sp. MSJ-3]|uniref:SafA/ExsA family spore coat assembly protein n=1 Tax=Amphibacillus sp. MSJ-3 TaxID=2841505 RepID=UPI001C0EE719|nr:SafA/ExsA family spore coat assembly protein [Amphibacillus sp. MSJ-3]
MKIHVVQKGDTLWNLSKKYNVDFQELKAVNSQLANPDLVMPGMKIKIPIEKKQVTKQGSSQAPAPKEKMMTPFKQMPQKAQPVIKEDDQKPKQQVQKKMPFPKLPPVSIQMPKLPNIHANQYNVDVDVDIDDYDTTLKNKVNYQHHQHHHPIQEQKKEEVKQPTEDVHTLPWSFPSPNYMWMPCMPCSMVFYPQQPYYPTLPGNMCCTYQDPSVFCKKQTCEQPQWTAPMQQSCSHDSKWGELDLNAEVEGEQTGMMTEHFTQMNTHQQAIQANHLQPYPYIYPMYGPTHYPFYPTGSTCGMQRESMDETEQAE